jgi:hypothetical protein
MCQPFLRGSFSRDTGILMIHHWITARALATQVSQNCKREHLDDPILLPAGDRAFK